jgi:hypothetical protein
MRVANLRSATRILTVGNGNTWPFSDPLHGRQEPALKRQIQNLPRCGAGGGSRTARWRSSCSVARISVQDRRSVCRRPQPPARSKPGSNACAASPPVPVAVLCCCTLSPAVRIMSLTCGAKGTRTPDPLLANHRQAVHPSAQPQVKVRARPGRSAGVRACCGTFLLYRPARPPTSGRESPRPQKATQDTGGITSQPYTQGQAPLSAIFCCASAIAPLRACTWWPSASPTTFLMARVTAGTTLAAAECG